MLTLMVFALVATAICFMDGKDWYLPPPARHRRHGAGAAVLGCVGASEPATGPRRGPLPVAVAAVASW